MYPTLLPLAAITLALGALATPLAERSTPLAAVHTKCTESNVVALTFDDGPYKYEQDLINILAQHNVKATFFVNGQNWDCIYGTGTVKSLQNAYKAGHQVGSHTWSHPHLTKLSNSKIQSEFSQIDLAIQRILGVQPAFFRPPYGEYNNYVRQVAYQNNQTVVTWDFDSRDSVGATVKQSETLYDNLAKSHPKNVLALNHETYSGTVYDVLPHAISVLKAKGYKFVTVAECLGMKPYVWVKSPQARTSAWHC